MNIGNLVFDALALPVDGELPFLVRRHDERIGDLPVAHRELRLPAARYSRDPRRAAAHQAELSSVARQGTGEFSLLDRSGELRGDGVPVAIPAALDEAQLAIFEGDILQVGDSPEADPLPGPLALAVPGEGEDRFKLVSVEVHLDPPVAEETSPAARACLRREIQGRHDHGQQDHGQGQPNVSADFHSTILSALDRAVDSGLTANPTRSTLSAATGGSARRRCRSFYSQARRMVACPKSAASLGRTKDALPAEEHKPSDDEEGEAQEDQARLLE